MKNHKTFSFILKAFILLCFIALQSPTLSAQVWQRTKNDSVNARLNNVWFTPDKYQFQLAYPKLTNVPPITSDMPYEIMKSYVYLDSLLKLDMKKKPEAKKYLIDGFQPMEKMIQ